MHDSSRLVDLAYDHWPQKKKKNQKKLILLEIHVSAPGHYDLIKW